MVSYFCSLARFETSFLGALWGLVTVQPQAGYSLGATRPTIPVVELSAIVHTLTAMRAAEFHVPLHLGTDSLYALGLAIVGNRATADIKLVRQTRKEMRWRRANGALNGYHYAGHVGCRPNDCADVAAKMGRISWQLFSCALKLSHNVRPVLALPPPPCQILVDHRFMWTNVTQAHDLLDVCRTNRQP